MNGPICRCGKIDDGGDLAPDQRLGLVMFGEFAPRIS